MKKLILLFSILFVYTSVSSSQKTLNPPINNSRFGDDINARLDQKIQNLKEFKSKTKQSSQKIILSNSHLQKITEQSNAEKNTIDSIITSKNTGYYTKNIFTYDNSGYQILNVSYIWDVIKLKWNISTKTDYIYNNLGKITSSIKYSWNSSSQKWVNFDMYLKEYDNFGNMTSEAYFYWDTNWVGTSKTEYVYDTKKNILQRTELIWENNNWENRYKYINTYNNESNITTGLTLNWASISNTWISSNIIENTYNLDETLKQTVYSSSEDGNNWVFVYKTVYDYDSKSNQVSDSSFLWESNWVNAEKTEYTYDTNNNLKSYKYYTYDNTISIYIGFSSVDFFYDTNGNETSKISYEWGGVNLPWKNSSKSIKEYTDGVLTLKTDYTWDVNVTDWVPTDSSGIVIDSGSNLSNEFAYKYNGSNWVLDISTDYYYSIKIITDTKNEIANDKFIIFPNPSSNTIQIQGLTERSKVDLYSINGELMKSNFIYNNEKILLSDLPKGTYIVKIHDNNNNNNNKNTKFIKN